MPLNALGFLTVVAYGTWFYGFGVLFTNLSSFHGVSASTLGITFGVANLISGVGAVATGRRPIICWFYVYDYLHRYPLSSSVLCHQRH